MRIWIDATRPECELRVFHMTLLERVLRAAWLLARGTRGLKEAEKSLGTLAQNEGFLRRLVEPIVRPSEIVVELPAGSRLPELLPADLVEALPLRWSRAEGPLGARLQRALRAADGEPVLALPGDAVVDTRVLEHLAWWRGESVAFLAGEGPERSAALRLEGPAVEDAEDADDLLSVARAGIEAGRLKQLGADDVGSYVTKLRKSLPAYLFRVPDDAAARRAERFLFESNYKGSTDFLTRYVFPPLVWRALGPLTRRRVHPNAVTAASVVATFLAVPFFAGGWWLTGLVLAYAMAVLDSVDGKLARVTFTSSEQGDVLDHGLDIVHPPFWYWAWAWGLSGGDPFSGVFVASLWMAGFYILDRLMETLFKAATGQNVGGWRPFDRRLRTFVSRRNVNLAVFTVALPLGLGVAAFYLIVAWQLFTLVYHAVRVVQAWGGERGDASPAAR